MMARGKVSALVFLGVVVTGAVAIPLVMFSVSIAH